MIHQAGSWEAGNPSGQKLLFHDFSNGAPGGRFIPKCYMEKESDHLEDFAPELAMVTKFGNEEPGHLRSGSTFPMQVENVCNLGKS